LTYFAVCAKLVLVKSFMETVIYENLEKLGLQDNEAKIYVALLEIGKGTVTEISKSAALNRTTGYDILERLCLYGIANRAVSGKKKVYLAEPPYRLRQYLENKKRSAERRLEELSDLLPDLQALFKSDLKPSIRFAQGKEEMINLYYHVLDTKSTVYSILNLKNYAEFFDEMGTYQSEQRAKRGIKEKVLAIENDVSVAWYKKTYSKFKRRQQMTEYRWLEGYKKYDTAGEINIFDDRVIVMLSRPEENVAFEIQSQTVADFLKIIFELAWEKTEAGCAKSGRAKISSP
jgi:sugar-specific transcriptional regulator TrmB